MNIALYPFMMNNVNVLGYELDESYYDIQGAYGYNGVVTSSYEPLFIKKFYYELQRYCLSNNIIAEFTRFHPLLKNEEFSRGYLEINYNRPTVYIDLINSYNVIYENFAHSVKSNLKKAKENNLSASIYKHEYPYKKEFIEMYNETMKRVNVISKNAYDTNFFERTFNNLPIIHFVIFKDNMPIASAICLAHNNYLHIHLEVSRKEYWYLRPNDLLIKEIIQYGSDNGYTKIHLGGGRTVSPDDSLLRFKKKFSNLTSDFYIGGKIYDEKVYTNVCKQWNDRYQHLANKYKNNILKYKFTDDINYIQEDSDHLFDYDKYLLKK
ncbi:MAG: GNAT family N-acetyltransferase [Ignavibacteriaceae bacterium]|nr:GNAT family N-acetyltransferase [Ignavibacteriaceae bacterium]